MHAAVNPSANAYLVVDTLMCRGADILARTEVTSLPLSESDQPGNKCA